MLDKTIKYTSFELENSDEAIGKLDFVSITEARLPVLFISSKIDGEKFDEDGEFIITGDFSENKENLDFDLNIDYPTDHTEKCIIESSQVKCIVNEDIINKKITVEQQSVRKRLEAVKTIFN